MPMYDEVEEAPTYPTIAVLKDLSVAAVIPPPLLNRIFTRYIEHADEYISENLPPVDGLPVNACMVNDNLLNVEEELVDATFNAVIYTMRHQGRGHSLVGAICEVWAKVRTMMDAEANGENVSSQ